jgi:hypothetical protein
MYITISLYRHADTTELLRTQYTHENGAMNTACTILHNLHTESNFILSKYLVLITSFSPQLQLHRSTGETQRVLYCTFPLMMFDKVLNQTLSGW